MHYYSFNIKDYHLATAHLSLEEDGCYRRILDMYYDTEGHLPSVEMLAKKIRAPKEMVLSILEEFFTELNGNYFNQRADSEIEKYKMMSDGGKKGAEIRWAKTRLKAGDSPPIAPLSPPLTAPNANHYPLPTSHEPSKPLSASADVGSSLEEKPVLLGNGKAKHTQSAIEILGFLNDRANRRFKPLAANLDLIASRLKEGATIPDCKAVIIRKCKEWGGTDMDQYLRPATLFNKEKFAQYSGEVAK
jgi:uncharacterized phage protein (TIGR02220 family)